MKIEEQTKVLALVGFRDYVSLETLLWNPKPIEEDLWNLPKEDRSMKGAMIQGESVPATAELRKGCRESS